MKIGFIGRGAMGRGLDSWRPNNVVTDLVRSQHQFPAHGAKAPWFAREELEDALQRGSAERDCRVAMTLQEEHVSACRAND